jgi:DNA-directed RNA polymerase subunit RPC12/RpoP
MSISQLSNEVRCPHCDARANETNSFDDRKVKHDDFNVCSQCGEVSLWIIRDEITSLRKATEKDLDQAKEEKILDQILELQDFVKSRPKK